MTKLNELNVKNKHKINGEASTLVEDLASHTKERDTRKLKQSINLNKAIKV